MSELLRSGTPGCTPGVVAGEGLVPGRLGLGGVAASPAHVRIPGQAEEEPGDAAPGPPRPRTLVEGGHDQGRDERQHPDAEPDLDDPRHGNGDRTQLLRRGRFGGAHTVSVFGVPAKYRSEAWGERREVTGHPAIRNPAETSRHYRPCHGDDLHRNREARRPSGPRRARPLLPDLRAWFHGLPGAARWAGH